MNITDPEVIEAARKVAVGAYAPYSKFHVGAAVITEDDRLFVGCNVENSAYGATICAEANAITTAVAAGARRIHTVAVACVDAEGVDDAYPCGNCRQLMNEFGVEKVIVTAASGEIRHHDLHDLLPHGFRL